LKRILHLTVVVVLTIVFIWFFLHNSNLEDVWSIMRTTSPLWLAIALLVNFSALLFRTWRWRLLIDGHDPPGFYPTFFANTVGYMVSTVLPIRAGDVVRPALLARRTSVRFSGALATVVTERILDLYALLLLFIYFVVRHWNSFAADPETARSFVIMKSGAIGAATVLIAMTLFIVGLYFFGGTVRRFHEWLGRFMPQRFRAAWMHFYDAFTQSLRLAQEPAVLARVVFHTAAIWFCLNAQFWVVLVAMHERLPFDSSFFISGIATVGLAIPTPGGVGGFHKACQLVLTTFYHFGIDLSVAVAVMFHIVGTLPVLVTGLVLFAQAGLRWRDVKAETEEASRE
jgi:glycosyltransferase 2 family protein